MRNEDYPLYELEEYNSFGEMVECKARKLGKKTAFQYVYKKQVCNVSYEQFMEDISKCEIYFNTQYGEKEHIAILGENSYLWLVTFMSAVISGNVAVCLDRELDTDTLNRLLHKSDTRVCICSDSYRDVAEEIKEKNHVVSIVSMKDLLKKQKGQIGDVKIWERYDEKQIREKTAAIFFTSGTSGESKGVMLSQWNMMSDINMACKNFKPEGTVLCVLPFHHAFGLITAALKLYNYEQVVFINSSLRYVKRDMQLAKPQTMMLVPLFVESFHKTIWQTSKEKGMEKKLKMGFVLSKVLLHFGIDMRRKIFCSVLENFGGKLEYIICGGAALQTKYVEEFRNFGIEILNGYGITECSPVIAVNRNFYHRDGSVGQILQDCKVRIHIESMEKKEGEIQVKGSNVMIGYYNDSKGTEEAFKDGWFKTGDLGYFDDDGFLYITGRKKNLIILPNGENVSPEELEEKVLQIPYIKEVVVSEIDEQIQAEVFLDKEMEPDAEQKIKQAIQTLNKSLPNYKKITRTVIREQEFEKTSTKKIKRN